jgi:voltage-gated sodium channel
MAPRPATGCLAPICADMSAEIVESEHPIAANPVPKVSASAEAGVGLEQIEFHATEDAMVEKALAALDDAANLNGHTSAASDSSPGGLGAESSLPSASSLGAASQAEMSLSKGVTFGRSQDSSRPSLTRESTRLAPDVDKTRHIYNFLVLGDEGGDKAWINTTRANTYIGGVILLNAIVLGVETDWRPSGDRTWYWVIGENFFAIIFFIEFLMRLHADRWGYFKSGWNLFDLLLVIMTSVDVWLIQFMIYYNIGGLDGDDSAGLKNFVILRILRLLRLVRVVRLFRMFRELYQLIHSLGNAVRGLTWVGLLLFVTIYVGAVMMTVIMDARAMECSIPDELLNAPHTLQNQLELTWAERDLQDCNDLQYQWSSVTRSMFTLFIVMTGEGWNEIAILASTKIWWLKIFFILFVAFTNLMVMNLIIGVIVEKIMSSAKEQDREAGLRPSEEDFAKLEAIFNRMDADGSGKLNTAELVKVTKDATIRDELRRLQIYAGTDAQLLMKLWDQDSSGSLDLKEFVDGAMRIRKSEHTQQLLLLQHDLHSYSRTLLNEMRSMERELRRVTGTEAEVKRSQSERTYTKSRSGKSTSQVLSLSSGSSGPS